MAGGGAYHQVGYFDLVAIIYILSQAIYYHSAITTTLLPSTTTHIATATWTTCEKLHHHKMWRLPTCNCYFWGTFESRVFITYDSIKSCFFAWQLSLATSAYIPLSIDAFISNLVKSIWFDSLCLACGDKSSMSVHPSASFAFWLKFPQYSVLSSVPTPEDLVSDLEQAPGPLLCFVLTPEAFVLVPAFASEHSQSSAQTSLRSAFILEASISSLLTFLLASAFKSEVILECSNLPALALFFSKFIDVKDSEHFKMDLFNERNLLLQRIKNWVYFQLTLLDCLGFLFLGLVLSLCFTAKACPRLHISLCPPFKSQCASSASCQYCFTFDCGFSRASIIDWINAVVGKHIQTMC
jgi:hypothetical protein